MKPTPIVQTTAGPVVGRVDRGVLAYLGIPYAAPPFGADRLRPPRPPDPWTEPRQTDRYGPTVPKSRFDPYFERMFPETWIPGEDCLNLNVWTPALDGSLPVMVWVHGGGYTNGSGSTAEMAGHAFARDGAVCVTLNYRVAADGFLFLDDGVANLGLQDQVAALEWVRDNIAAFGGDPGRVTLAGHSAGGSSVACLLSSERAEDLFDQAIIQSTSGISRLTTQDFATRVADGLARRLDVPATRDALAGVPVERFVRATGDLLEELETAPDPETWGEEVATLAPFAPTLGDGLLAPVPLDAVAAGQGRRVRLLTGTTYDETRLHLTTEGIAHTTEEELATAAARYGVGGDALTAYRSNRPTEGPGDVLSAILTDWYFRRPTIELVEARHAGAASDTWVYRIDRPYRSENGGLGACHGTDVPLVFDSVDVPETHVRMGSRPSSALATFVHGTWLAFVEGREPEWERYEPTRRTTGVLTDALTVVRDPDGVERVAWGPLR